MKKLLYKIWQKLNFWEHIYDNNSDNEALADIAVFFIMGIVLLVLFFIFC